MVMRTKNGYDEDKYGGVEHPDTRTPEQIAADNRRIIQQKWEAAVGKNIKDLPRSAAAIATSTAPSLAGLRDVVSGAAQIADDKYPGGNGIVGGAGGGVSDGSVVNGVMRVGYGYNGISQSDYMKALLDKYRSGVNGAADKNLATIRKNLADALAALEEEKSKAQPAYRSQLKTIDANEFANTEQTRELLNSAGWNPSASGLGIGEVGKIAGSAMNSRNDAKSQLDQLIADIARRTTLANTRANDDIATVEMERANNLAGAEADALMQADARNYSMYRDSVGDSQWQKGFDYNVDRANVSDQQWQKNFDQSKAQQNIAMEQWNKTFNYQASRDKVLDAQWLKNFDEQKRQAIVNEMVQKGQLSIQEAQLALDRSKTAADIALGNRQADTAEKNAATNANELDWRKDPTNPDNIVKTQSTKNSADYNDAMDIGVSMLNSKDKIGQPIYSKEQIMTWVRGLGLTPEEKAKLANNLGL